jgi:hypothetical protein
VKEEEVPNSLLSLPKEVCQYCISFVGQGHYGFVGSIIYKRINKIYANEDKDMKLTFWSNVAVSMDLAELCLQDYQELDEKDIRNKAWLTTLENGKQGWEMKNCLRGPSGMTSILLKLVINWMYL